jgi:D-alanyl-D-alanine-carboxypeptidase/D-alanyl-D-alanine-endopeptidase
MRSIVTHSRRVAGFLVAVAAVLVLLGHLPRAAGHAPTPGLDAVVDRVVQRFLVDQDIPGAAVGVVRDGQLVYAKGHGVRSVERHEPVAVDTLFQIGSVTKVFTTTLLVQLRDEGRVALDAPVDHYLPAHVETPWSAGDAVARPTLRQLATHRAGLPRTPPNRRDRPGSPSVMEPYSIAELYQGLSMTPFIFRPGTSWRYSNYGFAVLGHGLEHATGLPYEALLTEQLLKPLAMGDTKITLTAGDLERIAAHYWPKAPRVERQRWIFGEICAFAGLASTVPDLAGFVAMHLGATSGQTAGPVRGTSVLEMREPVATLGADRTRGITPGWFYTDHPQLGRILRHDGEVDGHCASLWLAPQVGTAVIVLANLGGDTAPRLTRELSQVVVEYGP